MLKLSHQPKSLHPAKALLHLLSLSLADGVTGRSRGAAIDSAFVFLRSNMRCDLQSATPFNKVTGVVALVSTDRLARSTALFRQHIDA